MFAFDKPLTWVIILVIVLLIFGAGKLPDIGRSLGKSIKEFKDETQTGLGADKVTTPPSPAAMVESKPPVAVGATPEMRIRRRIIKHPDGSEEIIEEPIS